MGDTQGLIRETVDRLRQVQEENEMLVARLRAIEEKAGSEASGSPASAATGSTSSDHDRVQQQQGRQSEDKDAHNPEIL